MTRRIIKDLATLLGVTLFGVAPAWFWWYVRDYEAEFYRQPIRLTGRVVGTGIQVARIRGRVDARAYYLDIEVDEDRIRAWAVEGADLYARRLSIGEEATLVVSQRHRLIRGISRGGETLLDEQTMLRIVEEERGVVSRVFLPALASVFLLVTLWFWMNQVLEWKEWHRKHHGLKVSERALS